MQFEARIALSYGILSLSFVESPRCSSGKFNREVVDVDDFNVPRREAADYAKRTDTFHWCGGCKQGFSEDHPAFDFTLCPLCKTEPKEGFLPWNWLRRHWNGELPAVPDPGARYEFHPSSEVSPPAPP